MNKKFVIILILVTLGIILLSSGMRNFVVREGELLSDKKDLDNKKSFLNLADTYEAKKNYLKAKAVLNEVTRRFPGSEDAEKAQKNIERLSINILTSGVITDDSFSYEIKSGDTLGKIASSFGTTVELLKKSNGLKNNIIRPGKFLKVNKAGFNILVNKTKNRLLLRKSGGEIIKTYIVSTGKDFNTPTGTFKIEEKLASPVWYKVGAVVKPDSSEYALGSRWMGLSLDGYGIHGTNDAGSIGKHITEGCVRMKNEDVIELYTIVPSGTEVTIVE